MLYGALLIHIDGTNVHMELDRVETENATHQEQEMYYIIGGQCIESIHELGRRYEQQADSVGFRDRLSQIWRAICRVVPARLSRN